jgi:biopolymer transport protein ExbB
MFEIVKAGGWVMIPIIACSVIAAAIILERLWTLQRKRVVPAELPAKVWGWVEKKQLDDRHIRALHESSPLGQVLAAGLAKRHARGRSSRRASRTRAGKSCTSSSASSIRSARSPRSRRCSACSERSWA